MINSHNARFEELKNFYDVRVQAGKEFYEFKDGQLYSYNTVKNGTTTHVNKDIFSRFKSLFKKETSK